MKYLTFHLTIITVPGIDGLQEPRESFDLTGPIEIEPGKGIVIGIERMDRS